MQRAGGRVWMRGTDQGKFLPGPVSVGLHQGPCCLPDLALFDHILQQLSQTADTLTVYKARPYSGPSGLLTFTLRRTEEETEAERGECHPRSHSRCPLLTQAPAPPPSPEGSGWRTPAHTPSRPTSLWGGEAAPHQPIYNPLHVPSRVNKWGTKGS